MAQCPKCGKKLRFTDVSQFCPSCGVNMRFVNFEENFYKEAKYAELSQANMHVKIRHMKAAFVGSKLTIARLIVMLLPLAALLVPAGSFTISLPYKEAGYAFSALGVYGLFSEGGFDYVLKMTGSAVDAAAFSALRTALFTYAAVAVIAVVILFMSILCFISYRNMQKIIAVTSAIGIVCSLVGTILIGNFVKAAQNGVFLTGKTGIGLLVAAVAFGAVFIVNLLLWIKGIPVEYDEGMVERAEIYKKVRSGEIDIDTLPQPIVETEETRKIDEEIAKEEENYRKKHGLEETAHGNE
jgi:hypothetical protein